MLKRKKDPNAQEVAWRWYPKLYAGKQVKKEVEDIVSRLKNGKFEKVNKVDMVNRMIDEITRNLDSDQPIPELDDKKEVYVITIAEQSMNLLDLYPEHVLMQEYYRRTPLCIIGLARGYQEAVKVSSTIILDYTKRSCEYEKHSIREYFFGNA